MHHRFPGIVVYTYTEARETRNSRLLYFRAQVRGLLLCNPKILTRTALKTLE